MFLDQSRNIFKKSYAIELHFGYIHCICYHYLFLFSPIEENFVDQMKEKQKRRYEITEFDSTTKYSLSYYSIVYQVDNIPKNIGKKKLEMNLRRI